MRVGMMVDVYRPFVSGVTHAVATLAAALEGRGHEVFVFTSGSGKADAPSSRILRSLGLRIHPSGYTIALGFSLPTRKILRSMDILHVHHPFVSGLHALRYRDRSRQPIVYTLHTRFDLYSQVYLPPWLRQAGPALAARYLRWFCARMDAVVTPSKGFRRALRRLGVGREIRVVPNGIDLADYPRRGRRPRHTPGMPSNTLAFVFTGRLGLEKNLHFLLHAFRIHAQRTPATHLVLVGEGPERRSLEDEAGRGDLGGRVHFSGPVPHESVPTYLSSADVFVTASTTEVHPLTVLEALAAGLPVVALRAPGVEEIVRPGENGLLVRGGEASLAACLDRVAADERLRRSLSRGARSSSAQYAAPLWAERMEAVYLRAARAFPR